MLFMRGEEKPVSGDALLQEFLNARDVATAARKLDEVLKHAKLLIQQYLKKKWAEDQERCDVEELVIEKLLDLLHDSKAHPERRKPISNFNGYVIKMAKNGWFDYLRRKKRDKRGKEEFGWFTKLGQGDLSPSWSTEEIEDTLRHVWRLIISEECQLEWRWAVLMWDPWSFANYGVASLGQIADAIGMEKEKFAALFSGRPRLKNNEIADLLTAHLGDQLKKPISEEQINSFRFAALRKVKARQPPRSCE